MTIQRPEFRVAIFVDGANMLRAEKELGWFFDPAKLLDTLKSNHELAIARWYIGLTHDPVPHEEKFVRQLTRAGYDVRINWGDADQDLVTKSLQRVDTCVEIANDMVEMAEEFDKLILLSGDGDFKFALDTLVACGKQIVIVAVERSADIVLRIAEGYAFVDLATLRKHIEQV